MITPTEELELRQAATDAWRMTWGQVPPETLTPEQAFTEGHYLGLARGFMACRETLAEMTRMREKKLEWLKNDTNSLRQDLRLAQQECNMLWLALVIVVVAGVWVAMR